MSKITGNYFFIQRNAHLPNKNFVTLIIDKSFTNYNRKTISEIDLWIRCWLSKKNGEGFSLNLVEYKIILEL